MDVKIACLSNIHNNKLRVYEMPKSDILIIAGGATNRGTHSEYKNFRDSLDEWKENYKHIVYVPDKTDVGLQDHYWRYHDFLTETGDVTIVVNTDTNLMGLKIWGICTSKYDLHWAYTLKDPAREQLYKKVTEDVDILVTHSPMQGYLDGVSHKRNAHLSTGCQFVTQTVKRTHPQLHICGGAHESYGEANAFGVILVNASLINKDRQPKNEIKEVWVKTNN